MEATPDGYEDDLPEGDDLFFDEETLGEEPGDPEDRVDYDRTDDDSANESDGDEAPLRLCFVCVDSNTVRPHNTCLRSWSAS